MRFAALVSVLALAASPAPAQENEYFTVPPQIFAPGRPARPTVTYKLQFSTLGDDFDLTPIVIITDEVAFSTLGLQYFSASGIPLLLGEYPLGGENPTQSASGTFDPFFPEPAVFTATDGLRTSAGKETIVINSNWGTLPNGMEGHQTTSVVTTNPSYGPPISLAVGELIGTPQVPGDVVLAHTSGLTIFEGVMVGAAPDLIEFAHEELGLRNTVIEDVIVGDVTGNPGDEILVATRNEVSGLGGVLIYEIDETAGAAGQIVLKQWIPMGAVASVHVLDADPLMPNGNDIIAVEHIENGSAVQVNVRFFQFDGTEYSEAPNSPLLTRNSPIGILPRYGAVGNIDGDEPATDDLVLMSNNAIVGPPNTSVTAPLYIDRFVSTGTGSFNVSTRFTRFGGRAVDPVLYDPSPVTVTTGAFADAEFSGAASLPDLHANFEVDLSAGSSTSYQTHDEAFSFVFDNNGFGVFEDRGNELIHEPTEFLAGVGDGHVSDIDGDAATATGGPDVVLPQRDSNEVRVQYGDGVGLGSRVETFTAVAVPPLTPGGPTDVWSGDLDGANWSDVVSWSEYGASAARWNVHLETTATANGTFAQKQEIILPSAGDMVVADATNDGLVDLVATQHTALGTSVLLTIATGASNGSFSAPTTLAADTNVRCLGGLAHGDYDGDSVVDFVTTYRSATGSVGAPPNTWGFVVIESDGLGGYTRAYRDIGAALDAPTVESVALATTDGAPHVAIGAFTGELWMARKSGTSIDLVSSAFQEADETCGGEVVFLDVDGDGDADLVSSKSEVAEQANVNLLVDGAAGSQFGYVDELQGWTASLAAHGNRVLGADFNGDGLTDFVLSHGLAGAASLLPNGSLQAMTVAAGTGGANGPLAISATGRSRLDGAFTVHMENANAFAPGVFLVGSDLGGTVPNAPGSAFYITLGTGDVFAYPPAVPFFQADALGNLHVPVLVPTTAVPDDIWYFQAIFYDTTISTPLPNYALSNGLAVTILDTRDDSEVNMVQ